MKVIVAVGQDWGIGFKDKLLFYIPEDMRRFKEITLNKTVVMGRKTLESLPGGKPLKDRVNIVLTKNKDYKAEGAVVCRSVAETLEAVKDCPADSVFIIGGERIYREFLPYCGEALITKVRAQKEADTFFPDLDKHKDWQKVRESEEKEYGDLAFTYTVYKNLKI